VDRHLTRAGQNEVDLCLRVVVLAQTLSRRQAGHSERQRLAARLICAHERLPGDAASLLDQLVGPRLPRAIRHIDDDGLFGQRGEAYAYASDGGRVVPRTTRSSGSVSTRAGGGSPASAWRSNSAPRRPLSNSRWRTVVSPAYDAISMSSNPITDSCSGTSIRRPRAASRTPSAWTSDAANTADGGSGSRSNSSAMLRATWRLCVPPRTYSGRIGTPARARARSYPIVRSRLDWKRKGSAGLSPMKAIRRCPSSSRYCVASSPPATSSITTLGSPSCRASMSTH